MKRTGRGFSVSWSVNVWSTSLLWHWGHASQWNAWRSVIAFCLLQWKKRRFGQVVRFSQRLLVVFLFAKRSLVDSRCGVQWAALQQSLPSGVSGLVLRISAGWVNQAIPVTHATTSRAQTIVFPCRTSYCTCSFTAWLYSYSKGVNVENPVQSPTSKSVYCTPVP